MKTRYSTKRSALGLIASGIATISIAQRMPDYTISLSKKGLKQDGRSLAADADRAFGKAMNRERA